MPFLQLSATTMIVLFLCLSNSAYGLGVGKIRLYSALNQPLRAEIEITTSTADELGSLSIKPASHSIYRSAGIERPLILQDMQFSIRSASGGNTFVEITTRSSIREPYLEFILEFSWYAGRLLRQYTLLIDPLEYQPIQPAQVAPPKASAAENSSTSRNVRSTENSAFNNTNSTTDSVTVKSGDSLWTVARQFSRRNDIPIYTVMDMLHKQNPHAFVNNDRDRLIKGATLHLQTATKSPQQVTTTSATTNDPALPQANTPTVDSSDSQSPTATSSYGPVRYGDNLWDIAVKLRKNSNMTQQQMMQHLFRNNPQAFRNNNINQLQRGAILQLFEPSPQTNHSLAGPTMRILTAGDSSISSEEDSANAPVMREEIMHALDISHALGEENKQLRLKVEELQNQVLSIKKLMDLQRQKTLQPKTNNTAVSPEQITTTATTNQTASAEATTSSSQKTAATSATNEDQTPGSSAVTITSVSNPPKISGNPATTAQNRPLIANLPQNQPLPQSQTESVDALVGTIFWGIAIGMILTIVLMFVFRILENNRIKRSKNSLESLLLFSKESKFE